MYFEKERALSKEVSSTKRQIDIIAKKFIKENPPCEYTLLPQNEKSFSVQKNGRYEIDFNKIYKNAQTGDCAYAACEIYAEKEKSIIFFCDFSRDAVLYVNGAQAGKTSLEDEALTRIKKVYVTLKKGKNTVLIRCIKNAQGFGFSFGNISHRSEPYMFTSKAENEKGVLGISCSRLYKTDIIKDFPSPSLALEKIKWISSGETSDYVSVFEDAKKGYTYAVTFLKCESGKNAVLSIKTNLSYTVFAGGKQIYCGENDAEIEFLCEEGKNYLVICLCHKKGGYLKVSAHGAELSPPFDAQNGEQFIYAGPFEKKDGKIPVHFEKTRVFENGTYWRTKKTQALRLTEGAGLFGRWTYPLGILIYGMLAASQKAGAQYAMDYVKDYTKKIAEAYDYCVYDTKKYNLSYIIRQQCALMVLDDFGSFCGALTKCADVFKNKDTEKIIDRGASFIKNDITRLKNGEIYRRLPKNKYKNIELGYKTIWADDLFMGCVFMCKYYDHTKDSFFLEDAALQFEKYFEYLYNKEKRLMSHVYCINKRKATGVCWGRGNGWVLLSLTEMLKVLEKTHPKYEKILSIFKTLAGGILSYQDENGMFHQVTNDPFSYAETSSTAMFALSFLRGYKNGWLTKEYKTAAEKAWRALTDYCIDKDGNLYGVCRGSGFSFREEYYRDELSWVLNDTHGIGIVLLLASEIAETEK